MNILNNRIDFNDNKSIIPKKLIKTEAVDNIRMIFRFLENNMMNFIFIKRNIFYNLFL